MVPTISLGGHTSDKSMAPNRFWSQALRGCDTIFSRSEYQKPLVTNHDYSRDRCAYELLSPELLIQQTESPEGAGPIEYKTSRITIGVEKQLVLSVVRVFGTASGII